MHGAYNAPPALPVEDAGCDLSMHRNFHNCTVKPHWSKWAWTCEMCFSSSLNIGILLHRRVFSDPEFWVYYQPITLYNVLSARHVRRSLDSCHDQEHFRGEGGKAQY